MNKYFILPCLMLVLSLSSCFKDKGSYDYVDINEIAISELGGPYNLLFKVDVLKIEPKLDFTMDTKDPNRYSYEWKAVASGANNNPSAILGNERNLNYLVSLLPGTYNIYFKVHDKQTDVLWMKSTPINVTTAIATGFMLMGEDENGNADVNMISMLPTDTVIVKSLLENNGLPALKNPIGIMHTGTYGPNAANTKLWIFTGDGSYFLNSTTFEATPTNSFKNRVFSTFSMPLDIHPIDVAPRVSSIGGNTAGSSSRVILTNNGDVFAANLFNGDIYGNQINRVSAKPLELFKVAPFLIYSAIRWDRYMVFDEVNNRFVFASATAAMMTALFDSGGPFPWNQGENRRKLHFAENTKNMDGGSRYGNSFALMKDQDNNFHIYKFYVVANPIKLGYYAIKPIAENFGQAKNYTFASNRTILFYSVGSKLYAYDYNPGLEKNYLVKDFGEEVTMIKCDIQAANGDELYVGTYSPESKGTLQKFTMGDDLNVLTMTADEDAYWTGLTKIKEMSWRNSTQ